MFAQVGVVVHGYAALRLGGEWQRDPERGAPAGRGPHRGDAAMRDDERAHDREAEPAAAGGARPGLIRAVEPLEHAVGLVGVHARAAVGHVQRHGRG
jgi:hypothetical protein